MSAATKAIGESAKVAGRTASTATARVRDGLQTAGGLRTLPAQARRSKSAFQAGWKAGRGSSRTLPGSDSGRPGVAAAAGAVIGLGAGYLLRDRLAAGARSSEPTAGGREGTAPAGPSATELNDSGLAEKVRSEIFRDAEAPKGDVNVNVEHGVVHLRGEVGSEWVDRLAADAAAIEGVHRVENHLSAAGTG